MARTLFPFLSFFFLAVTLATHRSLIFLHSILLRAGAVVMKINALHFNTFASIPSFFDLCVRECLSAFILACVCVLLTFVRDT